jgi:hypothetical protein
VFEVFDGALHFETPKVTTAVTRLILSDTVACVVLITYRNARVIRGRRYQLWTVTLRDSSEIATRPITSTYLQRRGRTPSSENSCAQRRRPRIFPSGGVEHASNVFCAVIFDTLPDRPNGLSFTCTPPHVPRSDAARPLPRLMRSLGGSELQRT